MKNFVEEAVEAYRKRHGKAPEEVICTPLAAMALSLKNALRVESCPVFVRDILSDEPVHHGNRLGIMVLPSENRLVHLDLR